jgi:hypothetical protein
MGAWHEIAVHGDEKALRGFVAGFLAGRGRDPESVLFGDALDLELESLGERLRDLLQAGSHVVLVAPEDVAEPLAGAISRHGRVAALRLERSRLITSARVSFRAEAFSEDVSREVRRALLGTVAAGAVVEDLSEKEERHPGAKGVELYAPMHSYVYRVSGRITGEFSAVLEMHRRARSLDFVETGRVHLDGRLLSGTA